MTFLLLLSQDLFNVFRFNWLYVCVVGKLGVGHNCCRVGVHQGYAEAFFAENSAGLCTGIVELAGLTDDDWAGTDNQNVVNICALRHECLFLLSLQG